MRDGFPQAYKSGEQVRHSELVGAVSRDSDKYIAQLPQGLEKGWELALPLTGAIPWRRLRGNYPKSLLREWGNYNHTKQPDS